MTAAADRRDRPCPWCGGRASEFPGHVAANVTAPALDVEAVRHALRFTDFSADSDRAVSTFLKGYRAATKPEPPA